MPGNFALQMESFAQSVSNDLPPTIFWGRGWISGFESAPRSLPEPSHYNVSFTSEPVVTCSAC